MIAGVAVSLALWTVPVGAVESAQLKSNEQRLTQAENLRVRSPSRVAVLLQEIADSGEALTPLQQHRIVLLKAHQFALKGQFADANHALEALLQEQLAPDQMTRALFLLAKVAVIQTEYEQAFLHMNRAIQLPQDNLSLESRLDILSLASELYSRAGAASEALGYGMQAKELALQAGSIPQQCLSWNRIASTHFASKNFAQAEQSTKMQLEVCSSDQVLLIANGEWRLASIYQELQQEELDTQVMPLLEQSLLKYKAINFRPGIVSSNIMLAKQKYRQGDIDGALELLLPAIESGKQLGQWDDLVLAYELRALIAEQRGQLADAMQAHKNYIDASKRESNHDKQIRLAYLQTQFKVERDKQRRFTHQKDKQIIALQKQNGSLRNWLLVAVGLVLALLFSLFWITRKRRHQVKSEKTSWLDTLTNAYTLEYASRMMTGALQRCMLEHKTMTVMMVDIDNCKGFNESHGYDVGDIILQAVAGRLQQSSPPGTILGRIDSDKFVMAFPCTTIVDATTLIAEYQQTLADIHVDNRHFEVTLCYGLTAVTNKDKSIEEIIAQAQLALNKAKATGPDQVALYNASMELTGKTG